ncbi:MAG: type II toxin-antitoxin system Phd/YefM family antitoxin [Candidatus Omnitrophota bacterium]
MTVFTYSQARQNLAKLLSLARKKGIVLIKRKDGSVFQLIPDTIKKSPLDVKSIKTTVTTKEIINCIRESRQR